MSAQPIPLRRFYVYVLKNEAGEVFYVGRGTGGRMMQHLARSHNEGVNGRLSEAVAGDERVTAEVMSWHQSMSAASAEEIRLIQSFPPNQLANITHSSQPIDIKSCPRLMAVKKACDEYREIRARRKKNIIAAIKAGIKIRIIAEAAEMAGEQVRKIARDAGLEPRAPGRRRERE